MSTVMLHLRPHNYHLPLGIILRIRIISHGVDIHGAENIIFALLPHKRRVALVKDAGGAEGNGFFEEGPVEDAHRAVDRRREEARHFVVCDGGDFDFLGFLWEC